MLRPEQILDAKFTPVSKGTYSAEEVDAFLRSVAESYEESLVNNQELIKKISILADKIESYRNDEEAIKLALLDAHKMADSVNKSATEKAEALVEDAENKSKIILDGANRQASQTIDEAKEKAKEIVENARAAVASLTEKAQTESDNTIAEAKKTASIIVADAEEKGRQIIGTSKQSYEFYSAELEKIQAETAKFKAAIEDICKSQLNLLGDIPGAFVAAVNVPETIPASAPVEEAVEEVSPAEEVFTEENVVEEVVQHSVFSEEIADGFDDIIGEIAADDVAAEFAAEETVEVAEEVETVEEEHDESAIALMAEINGLAENVFTDAENSLIAEPDNEFEAVNEFETIEEFEQAEEFVANNEFNAVGEFDVATESETVEDDEDLFGMIEDVEFDGVSEPDSFPSSLDDFVPMMPVTQEEEEISLDIDELVIEEDDDEFEGFQIDLDSVTDDSDDEDITSLFDSLFDD